MGMLERGAEWLQSQRHTHLTKQVTYRRGEDTVTLQATIGRSEFEEVADGNIAHRFESRDYLVRASDLVLNGEPILPEAGDVVLEVLGEATHQYEVMGPGMEPPYRWSDTTKLTLRIHTKFTGLEP